MIKFKDILLEGKYDPAIFKAIFIVGGPGSGKSFIQKLTTGGIGFKVVNSDVEFEHLMKKHGKSLKMPDDEAQDREELRSRAQSQNNKKFQYYIDGRLGVILDGTGKDYQKIKGMKDSLEEIGYDTFMILVNTRLDIALERNARRERSLPDEMVTKFWHAVQNNIGKFQSIFTRNNFSIIDNNDLSQNSVYTKMWKEVLKFANSPLSHIALKWINSKQ